MDYYHFATGFPPAQNVLADLKTNLFNDMAINKLIEKLRDTEAFNTEKKDFYFWNTSPYNCSDISYQSRSIDNWDFAAATIKNFNLPPQSIPLGCFTINAIPECYVQPKGNWKYDICVNKVCSFIHDTFNFKDEQPYGYWDLYPQSHAYLPLPNQITTYVKNKDFRNFQKHGYGHYFPVLSRLHEMEDFEPICLEYSIEK